MSDEQASRRRFLRYVMLAVLAWGSLLALGTALFGFDPASGDVRFSPDLVRGAIVETCVLGFVGAWWLLVALRR